MTILEVAQMLVSALVEVMRLSIQVKNGHITDEEAVEAYERQAAERAELRERRRVALQGRQ